jgi:hypothetical protein
VTDTNELRKLLSAATPGPWAVSYGDESWVVVRTKPDGTPDLWARRTVFDDGSAAGEYSPSCKGPTRDLIVAAVNALPALLDELDAARAEVERLRGVIYEYVKAIDDNAGSGLDLELEAAQLRYEHAVEALRAETNQ